MHFKKIHWIDDKTRKLFAGIENRKLPSKIKINCSKQINNSKLSNCSPNIFIITKEKTLIAYFDLQIIWMKIIYLEQNYNFLQNWRVREYKRELAVMQNSEINLIVVSRLTFFIHLRFLGPITQNFTLKYPNWKGSYAKFAIIILFYFISIWWMRYLLP